MLWISEPLILPKSDSRTLRYRVWVSATEKDGLARGLEAVAAVCQAGMTEAGATSGRDQCCADLRPESQVLVSSGHLFNRLDFTPYQLTDLSGEPEVMV